MYGNNHQPVETYARSMIRTLREKGHEVVPTVKTPPKAREVYKNVDLLLDIDCGRDEKGELHWHGENEKPDCLSAVYFIDTHGYPSLHRRLAKRYDHVFFCVWDKRDMFAGHPSTHWSPNFTDLNWFNGKDFLRTEWLLEFDFGFYGSKGGLDRADPLIKIANNNRWRADVRQIAKGGKHRWPETAEAMAKCRFLFNHGQKHDGPNLRVMESMAMQRPLITDQDPRSGMDKLFEPGIHYIPYEAYTYNGLEDKMRWCMENRDKAEIIAKHAYNEVTAKHLVGNRIDQILEVINA
jgi:hypothetical protein